MLSLTSLLLATAPLAAFALANEATNHPRDFSFPSSNITPDLQRRFPANGQIIESCTQPGVVALTFDDGPWVFTSGILDLLANYGVKATFFLTGNNFGRVMDQGEWPALIQRANAEGHQLASHTWTHPDLSAISSGERYAEMEQNEQAFLNVLGKTPTYMRPPYLSCSAESGCISDLTNMGYHIVNCNMDTKDYENDSPDTIYISKQKFDNEVSGDPNSSYIVLAHDVHEQTVYSLTAHMIESLRAKGYRAVTVGECLGDAPENWYR